MCRTRFVADERCWRCRAPAPNWGEDVMSRPFPLMSRDRRHHPGAGRDEPSAGYTCVGRTQGFRTLVLRRDGGQTSNSLERPVDGRKIGGILKKGYRGAALLPIWRHARGFDAYPPAALQRSRYRALRPYYKSGRCRFAKYRPRWRQTPGRHRCALALDCRVHRSARSFSLIG